MTDLALAIERATIWIVWASVILAVSTSCAVVIARIALACHQAHQQRAEQRYGPLIRRALDGDEGALGALVRSPSRLRLTLARLLIDPLIADRNPVRIAATRAIVRAMSPGVPADRWPLADRWLRSPWWWRRTVALRAFGLLQATNRTAAVVTALDDPNADVRNAALDALADMQDHAALPAIVVRLHDASLQRGRRAAALAAFGAQCEPFLLALSRVDPEHRLNYARALAICGTALARPTLCEWTGDARVTVRAAAFEALAHTGLDEAAASLAIPALESADVAVRAMAAAALHGWTGGGDAASHLARHLDDTWTVAVRAARSLQSMGDAGRAALGARAARPDLTGVLARQMLWEEQAQC
jgi:HEAT repeat protein